ncbi:MAG TPA: ABC transporter permease [Acidimicrobiales bacterium]|nr:ABC transporter permease [Acidimicrobiales bacterium]
MLAFTLRRLAVSIPVVIASSFIVFMLVATAGGDPLGDLKLRPGVSEATIRVREKQLGLDKPVLERYADWVTGVARGDLGRSSATNEEVRPLLWRRLGVTMRLVLFATIVAVLLAVAIGAVGAVKQYSKFDYTATFFSFVFFSMPVFWLAALLRDIGIRMNLALGRRLFFVVGEQTPDLGGSFLNVQADRLGHVLLPSLTLILISMASWSRFTRGSMLEVLNADYIRTARAKGLAGTRVLFRHALRNALIPVVTVVAIDFATILGGAVITETVFGWTGMGRLLVDALKVKDVNVVQAWLLVTAVLVVVFNLVADLLYGYLDPRTRRA